MGSKKYLVKQQFRENIEAEEIFLDAEAVQSLERKGKLEKPIKERNFKFAYGLALVCLSVLFLRTGYLQIVRGEYYFNLAQGNKLRVYPLAAPRGIIYDSSLKPLVRNVSSFDLVVVLADFLNNSPKAQETILRHLAKTLIAEENFCQKNDICESDKLSDEESAAIVTETMKEKIKETWPKASRLTLFKDLGRETVLILEAMADHYSGIRLEDSIAREYLTSPAFAHLLGYIGEISETELENYPDYVLGDKVGQDGLEAEYESVLVGQLGQEQIEVDSLGKKTKTLAVKPAEAGKSLVLSIDSNLQQKLFDALGNAVKSAGAKKGAAVAVDPRDGGILAMVSWPSFDNNLFGQKADAEKMEGVLHSPFQALLNRAVSGQYPPGSTIKPLIASAALEEQIISSRTQLFCPGFIDAGDRVFKDWSAHGPVDMIKAIAESCNVYFYAVGGGYGNISGLGIDNISKYLRLFGLGQISQIDLLQEKAGFVPTKEWREITGGSWRLGDTYNISIGQGDLLVTPLQMAMAISAIANGGTLFQPQVVDKIVDDDKKIVKNFTPKIAQEKFISQKNLESVRWGMHECVSSGSCRSLAELEIASAGKTGTAQTGGANETHAWFVGFAPYDAPEIAISVIIEQGGEGHDAAVPVAKEALGWYFNQQEQVN